MMPECERDPGFDPDEECVWDAERDLEWWIDGADDAAISGTYDDGKD